MKTYLVGGAVRDQMLGLNVVDRDWVVVGATAEEMLARGYQPVGKDFPVFLHPETKEEYALARKERKTGKGYAGFSFSTEATVTLEEDLSRRDLTINAMARSSEGELIDPHGGGKDLAARRLRHVSPAFSEDPLRVLRVARFLARFSYLGFEIDASTLNLMQSMSASGELLTLSPDRLWVEMCKGLMETSPDVFVECLFRCGAMQSLIPELYKQYRHRDPLPAAEPLISRRISTALKYAATAQLEVEERWAIVCHALDAEAMGSAGPRNLSLNPPVRFSAPNTLAVCERFRASKLSRRIAELANGWLPGILNADRLKPDYVLQLLERCDAFRESSVLEPMVKVAQAINATDPDAPSSKSAAITLLLEAQRRCKDVSAQQYVDAGLKGDDIAEAIRGARKMVIAELKRG